MGKLLGRFRPRTEKYRGDYQNILYDHPGNDVHELLR